MPTVPTNFAAGHVTTLQRSMTSASQSTGIILNHIVDPTDPTTTASWQITGAQILKFSRRVRGRVRAEWMYIATATVDATTKDITLGTTTRNIDWKDGASITSLGAGYKWPAGTKVELVWSHNAAEQAGFKDGANTWADTQTFSVETIHGKGLRLSPFASTAARDAYFTAPTNGDKCYVTGTGEQVYSGGAWVTINASSTSIASNGVAGTVDIANGTEIGAGTATDATSGAINVIPVSQTVKTSSGSSDENKLAILNSSGQFANGFIPDSFGVFGSGADGAVVISGNTTLARDMFYTNLTIDNGFTLTTANYKVFCSGTLTINGTIANNGNAGGAGGNASTSTGGTAGAAGTAIAAGSLPAALAGAAGGAGVNGNNGGGNSANDGAAGITDTNAVGSNGAAGVAGGVGGDGSGGSGSAGGAGGAAGTVTATKGSWRTLLSAIAGFVINSGSVATLKGSGGSGGGGGGGGSGGGGATQGGGSGGGGGSGSNGGYIVICASIIAGAGNITANGAAGGAAGNGANSPNANAGGGGGGSGGRGGSGGHVVLVYRTSTWSGSISVAAGSGGAAGTGGTGQAPGTNGAAGSAGGTGTTGTSLTFTV